MANRQMKRCLTSLVIREMEVKTTMRHDLTPVRMAKVKTKKNKKSPSKETRNKRCRGCAGKGTLMHC